MKKGITFIEMILGVCIAAVIALSIYVSFSTGMGIWKRAQSRNTLTALRLDFLNIEKELKKTFYFSRIPFEGSGGGLTFPLNIDRGDEVMLAAVSYVFEKNTKTGLFSLVRVERPFYIYGESEEADKGNTKVLIGGVKEGSFQYAYIDKKKEAVKWLSKWDGVKQEGIPSGIRISIRLKGDSTVYNKVIFLQHGISGST